MKQKIYGSSPDHRRFPKKNLKPGEPERFIRDGD